MPSSRIQTAYLAELSKEDRLRYKSSYLFLIAATREYFDNAGDPFALAAFGMTFYVVTQPKHSAEVYRNSETLSFEAFVQGLMRSNGNDENAINTMYSPLPSSKPGFPNPQGTSLGVLAQRMHIHQLHPGEN